MRSLVSRWPTELLLPVLIAGLETAAIAPLIHIFGTGFLFLQPLSAPWPLAIGAIGLLAFWSTRIVAVRVGSLAAERILSFILWLAALMVWLSWQYGAWWELDSSRSLQSTQRYLIVPVVLSVLAWWRGLTYASEPAPFTSGAVRVIVRTAWIVLVVEIVVSAALNNQTGNDALQSGRVAVPVAVICGLLAMAVAQIEQAKQSALRSKGRTPDRRTWVVFAIGATAVIIVGSLVVSSVLGQENWSVLYEPLVFGLRLLSTGLLYVLLALAFVVFLLLSPLIWLIRYAISGSEPTEPPLTSPSGFSEFTTDAQSQLAPNLVQGLRWALVAIVVPLVIFIVLRSLRRYQNNEREEEVDEERESLWSRDMVAGQLRDLFGKWNLRSARGHPLDLTREPTSVRDAYRYLTVLAARHGDARSPSETPSAFSSRMQETWSDVDPEIADLTDRYLRVRYGEFPDDPERDAARSDWRAIWRNHPLDKDGT